MDNTNQKAFIVYNPKAGDKDQAAQIRPTLEKYFTSPPWTLEVYETTGKEDVAAICRDACDQGATLVVSAGGDGTVVGVANGLVQRHIPLGIIPLGTGNLLARVFPDLNSWPLYVVAGKTIFLPRVLLGLLLTAAVTFVNLRGIRPSGIFQDATTFGLLAVFVVFAALGLSINNVP